jgi:hypothetical protein
MAILCSEVGLLLLQAPHTGSTSLGTLLRERLGGEMLLREQVRDARGRVVLRQKHQTLRELLDAGLITPEQRSGLLVVVGVRDPYDLVLTEYARNREAGTVPAPERILRRIGLLGTEYSAADFERFVRRRYTPGPFVRLLGRRAFVPVDWTAGADHVIRFERMQADLDEALRRVGVTEPLPIPHRNPTTSRGDIHYSELYTPAARAIVEAAYRRELDRFGYVFEHR